MRRYKAPVVLVNGAHHLGQLDENGVLVPVTDLLDCLGVSSAKDHFIVDMAGETAGRPGWSAVGSGADPVHGGGGRSSAGHDQHTKIQAVVRAQAERERVEVIRRAEAEERARAEAVEAAQRAVEAAVREEAARIEAVRIEATRAEAERVEAVEAERVEAERIAAVQEAERIAVQEAERIASEPIEIEAAEIVPVEAEPEAEAEPEEHFDSENPAPEEEQPSEEQPSEEKPKAKKKRKR